MLGAGAYGTALGGILELKNYDVAYYDPKVHEGELDDVLDLAEYVVLCVPSVAVPDLLPLLPKSVPLIVATKGILADKMLADFDDWMVISGPGFADDIKNGHDTLLTATDQRVAELFETDYLKFDFTSDRLGVLMCGALKNVYALWAGVLGLKKGEVDWREYINDTVGEMRDILAENGAEAETVELACGIKDLELTCALPSRNYEYGLELSKNKDAKPEKTVEGLTALSQIGQGEIAVPASAVILKKILDFCRV